MVHSSFKSLGITDAETIIQALLDVIGERGTLLLPALSYLQQPPLVHDTRTTPTCVGYLTEYFRTRPGVSRSLHPTHSVCAIGASVHELLDDHGDDITPCGEHSPFHKLLHRGGKILMLGCGLRPNTTMHAIEEYTKPPYLFGDPLIYTITDSSGRTYQKQYIHHGFKHYIQRYDRAEAILDAAQLRRGTVGAATSFLIDSHALYTQALIQLQRDPFYFVDPKPQA
jgi:aminoglycoside 3-N-acetyltransferase